ncbi:DUF6537 domain-containing protein [Ramlibacter sp. 2FC]|uniref:DUF6537 domain-containing protein n=1 Tax=Ramlibacter sp. 2FC TaxID=2502188 RepID=UPI0032E49485
MTGLRGTAFDVFGRTEERRTERALITEYRARIRHELVTLSADTLDRALAVARIPEKIRGFGHVKHANIEAARREWSKLQGETAGAHGHDTGDAMPQRHAA